MRLHAHADYTTVEFVTSLIAPYKEEGAGAIVAVDYEIS